MAGTVTETYVKYGKTRSGVDKVVATLACVGDSSDGTLPDTDLSAALTALIKGMYLNFIISFPGGTAPTTAYDVTLVGKTTGIDVLGGAGADQSATLPLQAMPVISATAQKRLITEALTFKVANQAVHSATFTVQLIFTRN
jgi:hypothetical protein